MFFSKKDIKREMESNYYELTNPQKNIWNTEMYFSNTNINNLCASVVFKNDMDIELIKVSLNELVRLHDSFRIKLILKNSIPMQYFEEYIPFNVDCTNVESVEEFEKFEDKIVNEKFKLLDSELYRFHIVTINNYGTGIIMTLHHMIGDSWSIGSTVQNFIKIYNSLKNNTPLDDDFHSYKDFIVSDQKYSDSNRFSSDKEFWKNSLKDLPNPATFYSSASTSTLESSAAHRKSFSINQEIMAKINAFCTANKISTYVFFMSIFSIYLANICNTDDVVLGTPILNRLNYNDKQTTGMFVTTIPYRIKLENINFSDFATKNNINLISTLRHQRYPYSEIVEDVKEENPDTQNIYNIAISYQVTKTTSDLADNYDINWVFNNNCLNDINIHLHDFNETGNLSIDYDYLTNKYSSYEIEKHHERILSIINQVLVNPSVPIKDVSIVTEKEKFEILNIFNNRTLDCPLESNIISLFEKQVKDHPDSAAVTYKDTTLTYFELNSKVNQFARFLQSQGIKKGDIVGAYMSKTEWFIISILALQKLGAAYAPMHPEYPLERVSYILEDCKSKILITDKDNIELPYPQFNPQNVDISSYDSSNLDIVIEPETLCYVIYTSGSTGKPKGVLLTHKNLINFLYNFNDSYNTHFSVNDNCLSLTNISFDVSVCEIYSALVFGARLVLYPENTLDNLPLLANLVENENITFLYLPPNILKDFYNFVKTQNISFKANKLLVGVEAIKNQDLNNLLSLNSELEIVNGYGPTETTICITFFKYNYNDDLNGIVPIGYPLKNNNLFIINKFDNLMPVGIPGELIVSGPNVSLGYMNNLERTQKSFVTSDKFNSLSYKTGDNVYWDKQGYINFIGRQDSQVKFRGHRIELSEINNNIRNIPGVINSITQLKEINGILSLCSYVATTNNTETTIKLKLSTVLPYYMIPNHIVIMKKLPINNNGKIDKKALPEINLQTDIYIAPTTETEKYLSEKINKLLNLDKVSIDSDFFNIGLDSLSAIKLSAEIYNDKSINLNIKDIFENNTIRKISKLLDERDIADNTKIINKCNKMDYYPLSSAQKRIYFTSKMIGEENLVYNVPGSVVINKKISRKKVEDCFKTIIEHQSSYRTAFVVHNDEIKQKIFDTVDFHVDSFTGNASDIKKIIYNYPKPFNLETAPLLRVSLCYLNGEKTLLLIDSHHIIMDGYSLQILINEFCQLYNNDEIEPLEIEYKDFAIWESNYLNSQEVKDSEQYWLNKFEGSEFPSLNLPYDFPIPPVQSYKGSSLRKKIPKKDFNIYLNYAKKLGVSPYMFFLSAFFILLHKYSSQDEIFIGSPTVGRDNYQLNNLIGMFVNNIVLNSKIEDNTSYGDYIQTVKEVVLNGISHQNYPFDLLVKKLGIKSDNSRNPLFDVMFIYQNEEKSEIMLKNEKIEIYPIDSKISKFNLSLEIKPKDHNITLEYCTDLFKHSTVESLFNNYFILLNNIIKNGESVKISDLQILSDEEKNKILLDFNDTKLRYNTHKTIFNLFEEQALKTPNTMALCFENEKITYRELNCKANRLANYLIAQQIKPNDIVGIMLPRSINLLVSFLAVLKAGACYIPIDPTYPEQRIEYMMSNSNAKYLITTEELQGYVDFDKLILLDNNKFKKTLKDYSTENPESNVTCEDLSYIIYTSGSTGLPKGVMLKHKSLSNLCAYLNNNVEFLQDSCPYKNIASVTTSSFDIFIFETLVCLQKGLTIYIANEDEQRIPALLDRLIKNNNIEIIQMTPSRMQFFVDNFDDIPSLENLKYVTLAGEPLPLKLRDSLKDLGVKKVYNGYGPSETTVFSTFTDVTDLKEITIGKPLSNTQMYILDKNMAVVPIGVAGELYIAGDGVGKGYLNRDDLTKDRYIPNPFIKKSIMYQTGDVCKYDEDGNIHYLGRSDNQVKIRGLRIELDEIENKILDFPDIKKAKVIKQVLGSREIISAYFIATSRIKVNELRKYLNDCLPKYMVPSYFTAMDEFPYTPNGKIDKKALPIPTGVLQNDQKKFVKPKTSLQIKLAQIWEEILNTKPIGLNDNFFELGGDSILAMSLNIQLLKITDKIKYSDIFTYPTIKDLAEKIESDLAVSKDENAELNSLQEKYIKIFNNTTRIPDEIITNPEENILLTGVTGFLGIHVLEQLLINFDSKIYVIIRKDPGFTVEEKLFAKLHYYFGNKYDNLVNNRIIIIEGDITQDGFGLTQGEIFNLANSIGTVINSAAKVSHFGNYQDFYNTNVKSVEKLLNFSKSFDKKLFHISTLSISGNGFVDQYYEKQDFNHKVTFKENNLYIGQKLDNVYINSKFQAERKVLDAITEGVDAYILRMGNLMPRLSDGKFQENISENAYISRLKTFMLLKRFPNYLLNGYLEFTPIDKAAEAIFKIVKFTNTDNRIYHIFNNKHVSVNKLLKFLDTTGITLAIDSPEEFKTTIKTILSGSKSDILAPIINDFDKDLNLHYDNNIDLNSELSIKLLKLYGFEWPEIDNDYLKNILNLLDGGNNNAC